MVELENDVCNFINTILPDNTQSVCNVWYNTSAKIISNLTFTHNVFDKQCLINKDIVSLNNESKITFSNREILWCHILILSSWEDTETSFPQKARPILRVLEESAYFRLLI